MVHFGRTEAPTFKNMAEPFLVLKLAPDSEVSENQSAAKSEDTLVKRRLSFSSEKEISSREETSLTYLDLSLQSLPDDLNSSSQPSEEKLSVKAPNGTDICSEQCGGNKGNTQGYSDVGNTFTEDQQEEGETTSCQESAGKHHSHTENRDAEVLRRAKEEGCVNVIFPGPVTQDGSYRFVSEILKCILYQRQQLPMTYDQLVYSQKKQQDVEDKDVVRQRKVHSADVDHKCQQTLQELEEVLHQLEVLFSLSRVPRVLLLMGGSLVLPKELYEINMEDLLLVGGGQCLRVSSCLRLLFRTLFVADLLSDSRPVRLMPTTVLALAHRDCGVGWFRPKLQFKIPTRVKNQIITLATDPNVCEKQKKESDWQDYVWFQAPVTIKGFSN
ncbi:MAD2L1-binding protein isoform X1 [Oryzias melastigma]|uniref:MAD2L1-binding protein isoform X1 n=1 Tax=Oryzias melastigma TaxID=30732 RepID=UPI000CF7E03D|nr:MAD2L1-binding protein isoform X1 [Oryzias melastigma]